MTLGPRRLCNLCLVVLLVSAYLVVFVPRIGLEKFRYDSSFQPRTNISKTTARQDTVIVAAAVEKNRTNVTTTIAQAQQDQKLQKEQHQHQQSRNRATTAETTLPSLFETTTRNQTSVKRVDMPPNNTTTTTTTAAATRDISRAPRRHVALLGPHDRFNFGDLLFEKVVSKLLVERAGYLPEELHAVGLVNVNMSKYGGHENIISIPDAIALSQQAPKAFDIIYLGGEALGCNHACGLRMLSTVKQRNQANESVSKCAYLFPKQLLVRNKTASSSNDSIHTSAQEHGNNVAIVNSPGVGGSLNRTKYPCMDALDQADYISFRDLNTTVPHPYFPHAELRPDSAVLTQYLFHDEIADAVQRYLKPAGLLDQPYLAVQMKSGLSIPAKRITGILKEIQRRTNYTVVFFRAGSTWGHDSLGFYRNIMQHMSANTESANANAIIFTTEHVWAVVALIQQAAAVLSTSLHVRIMAFVHQRPRVTWCSGAKHANFVRMWEAVDHNQSCVSVGKGWINGRTIPPLQASLVSSTTTNHTQVAVQKAIDSYLEGFDTWSKLLNRP